MKHLEVVLAGLLHDVGKFRQRAHPPGDGLGDEARGLEAVACPVYQHRYTHQHVLHSAQFILDHLDWLPPDFDRERILRLACYHHKPDDDEQRLVEQADKLSAGMEREADDEPTDGRRFRQVRLRAIADEIGPGPAGETGDRWVIGLAPLDPVAAPEAVFPVREEDAGHDRTDEYRALWEGFVGAWAQGRATDGWAFLNRALSVLERYTWCIPSATNVYPDISLYDHLKTTAAIAGCLSLAGPEAHEPFLLVTGDVGGIQNYLFGVGMGAGGLARRLRARSLFISAVTENTAHFILRRVGLPLTNCVLSAGGRFTLLVPNTEAARAAIGEAEEGLAEWAGREVGCELHPHLACLAVTPEGLCDFAGALQALRGRLEAAKGQPLRARLVTPDGWDEGAFVLPPLEVGEEGLCACCRRRAGEVRPGRDDDEPVCEPCRLDAQTGHRLLRARYLAFTEGPGRLPFGDFTPLASDAETPRDTYLLLDMDGGCEGAAELPIMGRHVARWAPRGEHDEVLNFEDLASRSRGRRALAYLKADVDNLGFVFSRGLEREASDRRSISRLATLSRTLELFFAGYMQSLAARHECIYTVYSGGDDLLMVGPWDRVVEFAVALRRDFGRYTCGNPAWSLSAGIALVTYRTPVLLAAKEAERRLEDAKRTPGDEVRPWPWGGGETPTPEGRKDRLVAFGTSLPWSRAPEALEQAQTLLQWLQDGALSAGQARRLLLYAAWYQHWQRTGDVMGFRYAPMLAYDIRRNWRDAPEPAVQWARGLTLRDSADMPALRFICEYALSGARTRSGDDER